MSIKNNNNAKLCMLKLRFPTRRKFFITIVERRSERELKKKLRKDLKKVKQSKASKRIEIKEKIKANIVINVFPSDRCWISSVIRTNLFLRIIFSDFLARHKWIQHWFPAMKNKGKYALYYSWLCLINLFLFQQERLICKRKFIVIYTWKFGLLIRCC